MIGMIMIVLDTIQLSNVIALNVYKNMILFLSGKNMLKANIGLAVVLNS